MPLLNLMKGLVFGCKDGILNINGSSYDSLKIIGGGANPPNEGRFALIVAGTVNVNGLATLNSNHDPFLTLSPNRLVMRKGSNGDLKIIGQIYGTLNWS